MDGDRVDKDSGSPFEHFPAFIQSPLVRDFAPLNIVSFPHSLIPAFNHSHNHAFTPPYARYFPTMGILRPMPKALGETLRMGGVW